MFSSLGDKLIKRQTVRLNLSCGGKCNLNDTSLQTVILNEVCKNSYIQNFNEVWLSFKSVCKLLFSIYYVYVTNIVFVVIIKDYG